MPRAGLSHDRIVAEAATVADEVGLDNLMLATVAKRCGVSLPGLYKHVAGLNAVKRDISVLAIRELTGRLARASAGLAAGDALRAMSAAYREYAMTCPGRYSASLRAPDPGDDEYIEASDQAVGVAAAVLQGYGLAGQDLVHAIRMWRSACHGLASLEAAGGFGLPESVDVTFERMIDALDDAFSPARRDRL